MTEKKRTYDRIFEVVEEHGESLLDPNADPVYKRNLYSLMLFRKLSRSVITQDDILLEESKPLFPDFGAQRFGKAYSQEKAND